MRVPRTLGSGRSRSSASFVLEEAARRSGHGRVAGVDEAGRGPLAGPVAAAAVILDPARLIPGLADSKTLKAEERERLLGEILAKATVGIAFQPARVIEKVNIREATLIAMREAVLSLPVSADFVLVDGRDIPPRLPCPAQAVVGGDALSASIAAASIVAKTLRDRLMARMDQAYPGYGFARHAGYGVAVHRDAIRRLGPCPLHRRGFAPFRNGTTCDVEA